MKYKEDKKSIIKIEEGEKRERRNETLLMQKQKTQPKTR